MKGINNLEQLAKVKSVIPQTVHKDGFAILNADDDLVYDMAKDVDSKVALFSMDQNNPRIKRHCEKGGLVAILENGYITICEGKWKTRIEKVINIPLTYSGKAAFMIQNLLPAVLTAFIRNFQIKDIRHGL
jgi:cyanophycin synthetase